MIVQLPHRVKQGVSYRIAVSGTEKVCLTIVEDGDWGTVCLESHRSVDYLAIFEGNLTLQVTCTANVTLTMEVTRSAVTQLYMSNVLQQAFYADLKNTYQLTDYVDRYQPTLFYGLMDKVDLHTLVAHRSLALLVWVGGDILYRREEKMKIIRSLKRVKIIAISRFIEQDLMNSKMPYYSVPLMGVNFSLYAPVTKGKAIYLYTDPGNENTYGYTYYTQLMKRYPHIPFIVTCCKVTYDRMIDRGRTPPHNVRWYDKQTLIHTIYPQCFIGLRLTNHDGLAGTVQELGLLGIKCIHNGSSPSALNYTSYADICAHIDSQIGTIGTMDKSLAQSVKSYLTINREMFFADFYL